MEVIHPKRATKETYGCVSGVPTVSTYERLAFGGEFGTVGPTTSQMASVPADTRLHDAAAEVRDRVAYRALLAFTFVLFVRPQDTIPVLDPLHLARCSETFGILALGIGRLNRGAPVTKMSLELVAVLAFGAIMLATAPFSIWPGGAVGVVTDFVQQGNRRVRVDSKHTDDADTF
jgi:hypothetical protein